MLGDGSARGEKLFIIIISFSYIMLTFPPLIHYLICDLTLYLYSYLMIYYKHDNVVNRI